MGTILIKILRSHFLRSELKFIIIHIFHTFIVTVIFLLLHFLSVVCKILFTYKISINLFLPVACCRYICHEEWPSNIQNYYYTLALLTLQFLVPLTVLIFTYTRIACAVWGKRPPGEAENSRDQRMARSKRKVSDEAPCFLT